MKALKIILIVIGSIVVLFVVVFAVYLLLNRQRVITSSEMGSPGMKQKVLIASQGSNFKNALVESLTIHLKADSVYIKVIDVTTLKDIKEEDWNAVVLIHTTEQLKMQLDVKAYLDHAKDLSKVIVMTTSGSGEWKAKDYNVDIITSASRKEELPVLIKEILSRLDQILKKTNE